jgi:hypothetical protein
VTDQSQLSSDQTIPSLAVRPAFILLFSVHLTAEFSGFSGPSIGVTPLSPEQAQDYVAQFSDFEKRVLGGTFLEARRITRWPLGRITLNRSSDDYPAHADTFLLAHKSGVALWEVWVHAPEQPFDTSRWITWLDQEAVGGMVAQLWNVLAPVNEAMTGNSTWSGTYFPVTLLQLPQNSISEAVDRYGPDLVRLLFLNQANWTLKRKLVREELDRDYCAREGGMTLFARRSGLDIPRARA